MRRDLDGGLKISLDALGDCLGFDDRKVVDLHLTKQIDPLKPRLEVEIETILDWTFNEVFVVLPSDDQGEDDLHRTEGCSVRRTRWTSTSPGFMSCHVGGPRVHSQQQGLPQSRPRHRPHRTHLPESPRVTGTTDKPLVSPATETPDHGTATVDAVVVLDFGSQYSQLITRSVRENGVYCELFHHDTSWDEVAGLNPRGVILSGGPNSVYAEGAPQLPGWILERDLPVLGICYGLQLMTQALGGSVEPGTRKEYGPASITGEQLAEEVYPSVVFFQDTYQMNISQIYVAGLPESGSAAPALRAQTGAQVTDLVNPSQLGRSVGSIPKWRMAGVVGALLS